MNRERRERIEKMRLAIEEARAEMEAIREDEEAAFEALPDSIRDGEKGEAMCEGLDVLEECVGRLDEISSDLEIHFATHRKSSVVLPTQEQTR